MLDAKRISQWYAIVGGWYGCLKAGLFIAGLAIILASAVWFFVLMCKLMVLGLSLIGESAHEFMRLYNEQLPLVQLVFLIALCWLLLWLLVRGCRLVLRTLRPAPAYIQVPLWSRTTQAYCPRFRAKSYGRNAYGYGN